MLIAWQHPFTNDEGAYLFDAKLITEGKVPGGDVLAKAPVPAILFSLSVWITHGSLFAARLVSIVASLLTVVPLGWLAYRLSGKMAAITTVLLLLLAVPFAMQVLGITEVIGSFFAASFLAVWLETLTPQQSRQRQPRLAMIAGMLLGLAFASRKTAIAVLIPALYLWLLAPKSSREQAAIPALAGVLGVILPWLMMMHHFYGPVGMREALGAGYSDIWQEGAPSIAGLAGRGTAVAVLARVGSGLVMATVIGIWWAAQTLYRQQLMPALPLLWLVTLVGLYAGWPAFIGEYLIDFFIPAILLAALALTALYAHSPTWYIAALAIVLLANTGSVWSSYTKPWTGMYTHEAIRKAASVLITYVPADESIFTAAVIIPYLSGHEVFFNITHPLWYRYDFIPRSTRETFLPPLTAVENEIRRGKTQWALVEHLTDYSYLRHESRLISLFGQEWELITTIPNNTGFRSNRLKLYKRGELAS